MKAAKFWTGLVESKGNSFRWDGASRAARCWGILREGRDISDVTFVVEPEDRQGYRSRFMRWSGWKEKPELSTGWSFKVNKTVKWLGWNEWPEIPPGWIFKISKMLWGSVGRKGRSFLRDGASRAGGCRGGPKGRRGRSSSEAGQEKSAAKRQESSIGDDRSSQVSPGC